MCINLPSATNAIRMYQALQLSLATAHLRTLLKYKYVIHRTHALNVDVSNQWSKTWQCVIVVIQDTTVVYHTLLRVLPVLLEPFLLE